MLLTLSDFILAMACVAVGAPAIVTLSYVAVVLRRDYRTERAIKRVLGE